MIVHNSRNLTIIQSMIHRLAKVSQVFLCFIAVVWTTAALAQSDPKPPKIANITAHFFLSNKGEFSRNVAREPSGDNAGWDSWNFRPIDDDFDSEDRFSSILVKLWFDAREETFLEGPIYRLEVTEWGEDQPILIKTFGDMYFNAGKWSEAVMIHDRPCSHMVFKLTSLLDQSSMTKALALRCGE